MSLTLRMKLPFDVPYTYFPFVILSSALAVWRGCLGLGSIHIMIESFRYFGLVHFIFEHFTVACLPGTTPS